jgi:predicted MFS family arabinose efflux permease
MAGIFFPAFALAPSLALAAIFMFPAGFGYMMSHSTVRAMSQIVSEPAMWGRVAGVTFLFFFTGMGLGSLTIGCVAKAFGYQTAMAVCGLSFLALAAFMFAFKRKQVST